MNKNASVIKSLSTHGMSKSRIYRTWINMRVRCNNPKEPAYKNYGALGIKYCKAWERFENFYSWAIVNGYTESLELDRINNYKNYTPSNCRWVTIKIQNANQKVKPNKHGSGVTFHNNRYQARININGIRKNLGCFKTLLEAKNAYKIAKNKRDSQYLEELKTI